MHSAFDRFIADVKTRLDRGRVTYGDRSFSREPAVLVEEIRDELRDVSGWAFILDCRLAAVAEALSPGHVTSAGETDRCTEIAAPTSAGSRGGGGEPQPMPRARDAPLREDL